jgi:hypothetical protein
MPVGSTFTTVLEPSSTTQNILLGIDADGMGEGCAIGIRQPFLDELVVLVAELRNSLAALPPRDEPPQPVRE